MARTGDPVNLLALAAVTTTLFQLGRSNTGFELIEKVVSPAGVEPATY